MRMTGPSWRMRNYLFFYRNTVMTVIQFRNQECRKLFFAEIENGENISNCFSRMGTVTFVSPLIKWRIYLYTTSAARCRADWGKQTRRGRATAVSLRLG